MRSLQVVNVRWYNATAWYGVTLAQALEQSGHPALVVGLEGTAPLECARELGLQTAALPLNTLNPVALIRLWRAMDKLVREFKPDVVNCHRGEAFILWALLKRTYGFALVRTRGDRRLPRNSRINRWLHSRAADAIVATNTTMAAYFTQTLAVPPAQVHTVLGGVDTSRFFPDDNARRTVRASLGFASDDVVVGLVGRMDEVKGISTLIQAFGQAVRTAQPTPRLRLLLIGFDSQYSTQDVARWTAEAGLGLLGDRVLVTGRVDKPEAFINALDLGVLASLGSEAIARAALEIMACGVPLVSSRVGVMPDLLPPEYVFEPGDVAAMASMLQAGQDPAWRTVLQTQCFQRIVQPPGLRLENFRDQILDLYHTLTTHP